MHESIESTFRLYQKGSETIGHILTTCELHQRCLLKERHDRVVYHLMLAVARKLDVKLPHSMTWRLTGCEGVAKLQGWKGTI